MNLYSVIEAAEYVGLKPETIKYHLYTSGYLKGQKVGNSIVFTQEELDAFKVSRPKPGPKPKD
jgi:excisionase family DNA binding protein